MFYCKLSNHQKYSNTVPKNVGGDQMFTAELLNQLEKSFHVVDQQLKGFTLYCKEYFSNTSSTYSVSFAHIPRFTNLDI